MIEKKEQYAAATSPEAEAESSFDIREMWDILLTYKYWFMTSVAACVVCAMVYLRYATPAYSVTSKVLIKDRDKRPYSASSMSSTFAELGLMNSSDGFDNEIEVLATKTLSQKVVADMKLYVAYYKHGRVKDREVYGKYSPYLVDLEADPDSLPTVAKVTLSTDDGTLTAKAEVGKLFETQKTIKRLPARIATPYGNILIEANPTARAMLESMKRATGEEYTEEDLMDRDLTAYICPTSKMAYAYARKLTVEPTSKTTTVAQLSMIDNIPERGSDYLNKLVEIYNEEANIDNNIEATRTEEFIKDRIDKISKELSDTEDKLASYKRSNSIVNYENDAELTASQAIQYETRILDASTQLEIVSSLLDYVSDSHNRLKVVPVNIGLQDTGLTQAIAKYNETIIERDRLLRAATENSPSVTIATQEAEGYFATVKTSINSAKRQLTTKVKDLKQQQAKYTGRITSAPTNEKVLADIERSREVKSGLYLMLLQKREENAIQLASTAYKAKVIEEPTATGPVSPKRNIILIAALVIGLAIPFAYYYIRNFFRYRIEGADDLAKLTNVPILGTIPFVKALAAPGKSRAVVVKENKNSMMVEVYRSIRSNLPFVLPEGKKVILLTSTSAGEGKTSIASNLGASIAFVGKKVLIMGLDIRKPRLAGLFDLPDTEKGISSFLARSADDLNYLDSLIQGSGVSDNLHILPAGPIPPNPAELLEKENLKAAVEHLKQKYDYIIMDTAPIGMVTDTLSIAKLADLSLYVVRANYSLKADTGLINELHDDKRLPNMNLLINGVNRKHEGYGHSRYGHYGYGHKKGYGYGYGYGYGSDKKQELDEI